MVSDRITSLKLEIKQVMLNVVGVYAPQVGWELEEKEKFWSNLDEEVKCVPKGIQPSVGNFRSHIGDSHCS